MFALLAAACPLRAEAASFEVSSDVVAQGYDVASPWGDVVLRRRRLMTALGLAAYDLQGEHEPMGPTYEVQLRLRLDADFGVEGRETQYTPTDPGYFVPGLAAAPVDLMYGYVEGRRLAGGLLGFRAGRQYTTDVLGWWSFDGALLRVTTPLFVEVELYGGLEQRGGMPLSSARFEPGGVWRGVAQIEDRASDFPSYQPTSHAPGLGVAVQTAGPNWLNGRFDYRRGYNTGRAFTGQFPSPGGGYPETTGLRLSQERLGYAASAYLPETGGLRAGFAYDLYTDALARAYGGLEVQLADWVTVGADGDYFVPSFDADSIWNWFTHNGVTTALGRVAVEPARGLDLDAQGGVRLWMASGDPSSFGRGQCTASLPSTATEADLSRCLAGFDGIDPSRGAAAQFSREQSNRDSTLSTDLLSNLEARYRWTSGLVSLRAMLQTGFGESSRGRSTGAVLAARQELGGNRIWLGGQLSLHDWIDPLRPERDATGFGYVLAPEYAPVALAHLRLEWEHEINRLVGQRFCLLGVARLEVLP
ncbi:MAG: hypothetical protein HY744_10180 [Deltaproteobacteria bacterium]|nr:hypothetical protein [Deltaproteobacteria bacterium]